VGNAKELETMMVWKTCPISDIYICYNGRGRVHHTKESHEIQTVRKTGLLYFLFLYISPDVTVCNLGHIARDDKTSEYQLLDVTIL
jgi:hypothetical protein